MHEHASKMELEDKKTVAICIQASVHDMLSARIIHRYTRMVRIIRVWYTKLWYIPYAYRV